MPTHSASDQSAALLPPASCRPSSRRDFLKHTALSVVVAVPTVSVLRTVLQHPSRTLHPALTLVQHGRSTYAIVVLPDAPLAAQFGATELQQHLELISGARLPIVAYEDVRTRRLPPGVELGHLITLGAAPAAASLPHEAFRLRTQGPTLEITGGGPRGTLYGCYALLDDLLGVRWFTPEITRIPKQSTITLPALDWQDAPAFEYRFPFWVENLGQRAWSARNRVNADRLEHYRGRTGGLDASTGGSLYYGKGYWCHTFSTLIPPQDYPQFWPGDGLCLSDPAVVPVAIARLTAAIQADPTSTLWSVSQDDNYGGTHICRCAGCQAIMAEEGAPSGAILRFVNAIAEQIEPQFPHVLLDTLAYTWTEAPPKLTRPRRNVRIRFAPMDSCVAHPLGTCSKNREAYEHLVGWTKIMDTKHLYLWHYSTNCSHNLLLLPNLTAMCQDLKTFHHLGGIGVYDQGNGQDYNSSKNYGDVLAQLRAYLQAKLMWNPERDARALIQEYLAGVYRSGAPYIQQWLDVLEAEVRPGDGHGERHAGIYDEFSDATYLNAHFVARSLPIFDAAERATAQEPEALEQIRKLRTGLLFVQYLQAAPGTPERARIRTELVGLLRHFDMHTS